MKRAIFSSIVAVAFAKKRELQRLIARKPGARAPVASFGAIVGGGWAMFAFGAGLIIAARSSRDPKLRALAKRYAASGIVGFTIFQASRFVLAERRPYAGGEMRFFALDGHGVSGHTFATALLYGPIVSTYAPGALGRGALLAWISFIAWSRVRLDEHYVWNVLLGGAMGVRISRAISARV